MIKFIEEQKLFQIDTKNTSYVMRVSFDKFVEHVYYGKKLEKADFPYKDKIISFAPFIKETGYGFSLCTRQMELSFFDSGDLRDTGVRIKNADGNSVTLFYYKDYKIFDGRIEFSDMPYSRNADKTLELIYFDPVSNCELSSYYSVFYDTDTITRYMTIRNVGSEKVTLESVIACQVDFAGGEYDVTTLNGCYYIERMPETVPVACGIQKIYSKRGHSSSHFNPYIQIAEKGASEYAGNVFAMNMVYSGDFVSQVERTYENDYRVMTGINPETFNWILGAGEQFTTPEAVISFSSVGKNKLTQNFHDHVREYIVPKEYKSAKRPIVINSWEAMYFNIDEEVLLKYAEKANELGIDTLVVDDGWFLGRDNDKTSLGDWIADSRKFKDGLKAFSDRVHERGVNLGIWIEPDMISEDSDLYRQHPDWAIQVPNRPLSLGRNQLVLDMTNDDAINHVVNQLKETFKDVKIEYIKWDFNRSLSEVGSLNLPKEKQGEVKHRFTLGDYKMRKALTEAFPDAMFEGCSGGGGLYDMGIMFYCPQIWASDNTDPVWRIKIQQGSTICYPLSVLSAHVANTKSNKIEKGLDYDYRYAVASGAVLGYELNITKFSKETEALVKAQVNDYQDIYPLVLDGDFFIIDKLGKKEYGFTLVSKDKKSFAVFYYNYGRTKRTKINVHGLDEQLTYNFMGKSLTGKEIMQNGIELPKEAKLYFTTRSKN